MLNTMRTREIRDILDAALIGEAGPSALETEVVELSHDSRITSPGSLYFCIRGRKTDGHSHASEAVAAGAVAIVCEEPLPLRVPQLVVRNSREAMNRLSAAFFGFPSRKLVLIGTTGTNGKTTTTFMVHSILEAADRGNPSGLIGTIEIRAGGERFPGVRTTPESPDLQRHFYSMVQSGITSCAMEVTSIGLHEGRIEGCEFDVAVFTNLSRDHLEEYHGTMEDYFSAKQKLFDPRYARRALVNTDDSWGRRLASEIGLEEALTYGAGRDAAFRAEDTQLSSEGSSFRAVGIGMDIGLNIRIPGHFNVSNALAAAGAAHLAGIEPDAIREGLSSLGSIPGRFEAVEEGQGFALIVDYAHTPDGLDNVLTAARGLIGSPSGRVIAVFGCGGERDRTKRPLMGRVASALADLVIVTSDNPRGEDPLSILGEIEEGIVAASGRHVSVVDRTEAIELAISLARPGDFVVIAGKGHEKHQEVAGSAVPFDDRQVAISALRRLR